jgi:hypothetical protein
MADIYPDRYSRPAPGDEPGADSLSGVRLSESHTNSSGLGTDTARHHIPENQSKAEVGALGHNGPAQTALSAHNGEGTTAEHVTRGEGSLAPHDNHHHKTSTDQVGADQVGADQEARHPDHEPHDHHHA